MRRWLRRASLVGLLVALVLAGPAEAGFQTMSSVSAGAAHTCAVTTLSGIECWGDNTFGQIGNGTTVGSPLPVDVVGVTGATAVSTAYWHTCAIVGGGVRCWGANGSGQLGTGSTAGSATPVDVAGLGSGATALATGAAHSCAVVGGGVRCWGANGSGQLGDGSTVDRLTPVEVTGLSGASAITAGSRHTCAVVGGGVRCWGANGAGQLGNGSTTASATPVDVAGLAGGVVAVSAGDDHTCALLVGGAVRCWGDGIFGQLGGGGILAASSPIDVIGLTSPAAAIGAGADHTCAILVTGGITCWGWNIYGKLGNGTTAPFSAVPVDTTGVTSPMAAVSAGRFHTCALSTGGLVRCWGRNAGGQLGNGATTDTANGVEVAFPVLPDIFPAPPADLLGTGSAKKKAAPRNPCLAIKGRAKRAACVRLRALATARAACRRLPATKRGACLARVTRAARR